MATYRAMFEIEVKHSGLNKYRNIRGSDRYVVEQKARMLNAQWNDEWERKLGVCRS
jgi:restriction system protein